MILTLYLKKGLDYFILSRIHKFLPWFDVFMRLLLINHWTRALIVREREREREREKEIEREGEREKNQK